MRKVYYSKPIIIISLITIFLGFFAISNYGFDTEDFRNNLFMPKNGCVPDQATAIKVAEAIWLPVYGESIFDEKPYNAVLIDDSIWVVTGTLPEGMLGGVAYIEIQKKDAKILGLIHGK